MLRMSAMHAAVGLLLGVSLAAQANDKLFVLTPAGLEADATANENIKRECVEGARVAIPADYGMQGTPLLPLKSEVVAQTVRFLSARKVNVEEIQDLEKAGAARVLRLAIVNIEGAMGGSFTGRKGMTVEAVLLQNGKEIRGSEFTRRAVMGPGGPDTCMMLNRIAAAIGRDVADWLVRALAKMPSVDAPKGGTENGPAQK